MTSTTDPQSSHSHKPATSHAGFNREVPDEVFWSEDALIRKLPQEEHRKMCRTASAVSLAAIVLFLLPPAVFVISHFMEKICPFFGTFLWITGMLIIWLIGILYGAIHQHILKLIIAGKIRSRKNKLFDPREGVMVSIEDPFTYDKFKIIPDDFGFLKITPEGVLLEMTSHRAQICRSALSVSLLHTNKNSAGIRLSIRHDSYPWTIVVCPMANTDLFSGFVNSAPKSRALMKVFDDMGYLSQVPKAEVSPPMPETSGGNPPQPVQHAAVLPQDLEHADLMEKRYQTIRAAIGDKINRRKKNWWKNIAVLLVSLFIFFQLGFFKWGLEFVLLILLVLLIHETGHFVGMKLFGYRNIQMFFIPMFGAAVSGLGSNVAVWKKAVVSLLGPLPGIFIGAVLLVISIFSEHELYFKAGLLFLLLNALNLLPIMPLDGGRFLQDVLFSRNRYLELTMNVLAALIFLGIGFALKDWIFKILGFMNLFSIQVRYRLASAADRFRDEVKSLAEYNLSDAGMNEQEIPEALLKRMLDWIHKTLPGPMKPKDIATMVLEIWDRIRIRPPQWLATVVLLLVFSMGYFVTLVSVGAAAIGYYRNFSQKSRIVAFEDADQVTHYKQQKYLMGSLDTEIQLSDDQQYYHGFHKEYGFEGALVLDGQWNMGRRTGFWKYYDPNTSVIEEIIYEENRPILTKKLERGQWTEYRWEDFIDCTFQVN